MTEQQALQAIRMLLAAYAFGGLTHKMWERAYEALPVIESELRCAKAERRRAQEACEQISARIP